MKKLTPRQINQQRKQDGKPPLNFALLRRIIRKIETNPEAYDQGVWGRSDAIAPCGTAACIAGWAAHLGGAKTLEQLRRNPKSVQGLSAKLLGLHKNKYDTDEIDALFDGDPVWTWPKPFSTRYDNASIEGRAQVAVQYLKHIVATGEIRRA